MKKILFIICCMIAASTYAQQKPLLPTMEDLVANSTDKPDSTLKYKLPLFYSVYQTEKANDPLIKSILFLKADYEGQQTAVSVRNGNIMFISQNTIFKSSETEQKSILKFYGSLGFIHAYNSHNFASRDTSVMAQREVYIEKFVLNKALSLNDNCKVLKAVCNQIKTNSLSNYRNLSEGATEVMAMPLYKQYLAYSVSALPKDRPSDFFELPANKIAVAVAPQPVKQAAPLAAPPPVAEVQAPATVAEPEQPSAVSSTAKEMGNQVLDKAKAKLNDKKQKYTQKALGLLDKVTN